MSSYFSLWHETRSISIRLGSIFILNKYWLLSPWNRNIFFCFEIWDSAIWPMDIYSRQRKNPSPIDVFTRTSKMYIMNRSFQFKALLTLNAIPIGFFIIIFFRVAVFYYISTDDIRMQFIDAVEIIYFFHSLHSIKRQTTIHIFRPKYFI